MEIEIPSPSVFLRKSPVLPAPVPTPLKKFNKPRGTAPAKQQNKQSSTSTSTSTTNLTSTKAVNNVQAGGITKPKQSKSRNGCMTCKKKRLKCDETKPTCVQCEKRNVECEGYKKDYKWRSFEETNKQSRAGKAKKIGVNGTQSGADSQAPPKPQEGKPVNGPSEPPVTSELHHAFTSAAQAITRPSPPPTIPATTSPPRRFSPQDFEPLPILHPGFSPSDLDLPSPFPSSNQSLQRHNERSGSHDSFSGGSPTLADLLLPGTDMNQRPDSSELRPPMSPLPYQPGLADDDIPMGIAIREDDDDFDEEILRQPFTPNMDPDDPQWKFRAGSPAMSDASSTSSRSTDISCLRAPPLDPASPEMLMLRFDKETCGILSIKDGPSENPWRTLIWPIAKDSHALYHAISSMAALHGATRNPQLRIAGMAHMTKSISKLSAELHRMSLDQALATSLALALGEGWDEKISTGIQHLKGAKTLLNHALIRRNRNVQRGRVDMDEAKRLRFLVNTYVYLDVIARMSSDDGQDDIDLDQVLHMVNEPFGSDTVEVDPLMGCATGLFPLMGKVASLVQRVLRTNSNSLNIVSEANELREQLLDWQPPNIEFVEQPEDPSSQAQHAIQTAEAYRRAILLHLHQAVPELAADSAHAQAKSILTILANTPLSSRTMIIQIFPLLVGSCEMVADEDRQWVMKRWEDMMRRLSIVNVASCWKLVCEVWKRRDENIQEQARRLSSRAFGNRNISPNSFIPPNLKRKMQTANAIPEDVIFGGPDNGEGGFIENDQRPPKRRVTFDNPTGFTGPGNQMIPLHRRHTDVTMSSLEPEYTVRGPLHWLGVMREWQWEVFLG